MEGSTSSTLYVGFPRISTWRNGDAESVPASLGGFRYNSRTGHLRLKFWKTVAQPKRATQHRT
jgi:hypothetical protein